MNARIFVSYARPDAEIAGKIVRFLNIGAGFDTWFDQHNLLPGDDWRLVIENQISKATLLILCLSGKSVNRTGFFQKELRLALEQAELKPQGEIFILPIRLDECEIPPAISRYHVQDMFAEDAPLKLLEAINKKTGDGARTSKEEREKLVKAIHDYKDNPPQL